MDSLDKNEFGKYPRPTALTSDYSDYEDEEEY